MTLEIGILPLGDRQIERHTGALTPPLRRGSSLRTTTSTWARSGQAVGASSSTAPRSSPEPRAAWGGLPQPLVKESIERFATEIAPAVRATPCLANAPEFVLHWGRGITDLSAPDVVEDTVRDRCGYGFCATRGSGSLLARSGRPHDHDGRHGGKDAHRRPGREGDGVAGFQWEGLPWRRERS